MRSFRHLTKTARQQLETMLNLKVPVKEIAKYLDVHISTIYREIKRGEYQHRDYKTWNNVTKYSCDIAQDRYEKNLKDKGAEIKLGKDFEFANYIEHRIVDDKLSPGAVLGEIKKNNIFFNTSISINTLYKYIERGYFSKLEMKHLPLKSKKKN